MIRLKAPATAHQQPTPPPPAPGTPAKQRCLVPTPSSAAGTPRVEKASTKATTIAHKRPPSPPAPVTPAKRRRLGPPPSSMPETPQQVEKLSARAAPRRAPTTAENTEKGNVGPLLAKIARWQKHVA